MPRTYRDYSGKLIANRENAYSTSYPPPALDGLPMRPSAWQFEGYTVRLVRYGVTYVREVSKSGFPMWLEVKQNLRSSSAGRVNVRRRKPAGRLATPTVPTYCLYRSVVDHNSTQRGTARGVWAVQKAAYQRQTNNGSPGAWAGANEMRR